MRAFCQNKNLVKLANKFIFHTNSATDAVFKKNKTKSGNFISFDKIPAWVEPILKVPNFFSTGPNGVLFHLF